jgi:hypothetical protein
MINYYRTTYLDEYANINSLTITMKNILYFLF